MFTVTNRITTPHKLYGIHLMFKTNASSTSESQTPNPRKITSDMIGPVDPVSNLRPIIIKQSPNETELEKKYREKRREAQEWNQKFWTAHNTRFFNEREKYLKINLPKGQQSLTADEMSVFYKGFLDKNWKTHVNYNKEWYKKNVAMLGLAVQIKITNLFKLKSSK